MLDPNGPLPPTVYWRRRAIALALALTVTVLLGWCLALLFGGAEPEATERLAAPATASKPAEKPPAEQAAAPPPECPDDAIRVAAEVGRPSFKTGEKISLGLVVTNTGQRPCVRDLNRVQREIEVLGPDGKHVWGSNDCVIESTNEKPLLRPGQPVRNDVVWPGLTSTPDCGPIRERIAPGDYTAVAKLGEITSDPAPFKVVAE
ncbi:hypothetical protein [Saccharopolyspora griseoalba]|uniref:MucR family transcriptional regulator n=1 Tax=Saccharopolyspora griseoalba TaxID=1431848 RepID=A0ABW2LJ84_9PSEU